MQRGTVLDLCKLKKITATVLKSFAIFKNVVHSLEPGDTPSKARNYAQRS